MDVLCGLPPGIKTRCLLRETTLCLSQTYKHTNMYALRVDGCLAAVLAWLAKECCGGYGVREVASGDNEHWHFAVESDKKLSALRTSFNRACPELKGNGKYSLTEVKDEDKYVRYMAKGNSEGEVPEVVWRNSIKYDDEAIEKLHDDYWTENRKLKKRKAGSMIDYVVDEAKRRDVKWDKRDELAKIYIRRQGELGKPINLFSLRANLNAVQVALCPDDSAVNELVDLALQH